MDFEVCGIIILFEKRNIMRTILLEIWSGCGGNVSCICRVYDMKYNSYGLMLALEVTKKREECRLGDPRLAFVSCE